jgi:hypothetical protein
MLINIYIAMKQHITHYRCFFRQKKLNEYSGLCEKENNEA